VKIWFRINGFEFCSWFIVFKHLMVALRKAGAEVPESPFSPPKNVRDYIELHWADPAFWSWSGKDVKLKAGIALSEHRSLLSPEKAIPNLQECDVLLCPCESSAQAYYEAPLDMPIRIIPFGVDGNDLSYHKRDWQNEQLRFLMVGVAQFRKGTWLGVEAFRQAFGDRKDVSLTVASFIESQMYDRLKREYDKHDNITFVGKTDDVKELYHAHHILVSPHLSEGWALTIPEAMATGMPGIIARCSAPREYFSADYGWWIEMSDNYAPVDQCLEGVQGSWRLPDVNSVAKKMKYAADNRDECSEKGRVACEYARSEFTWKQSAQKLINTLEEYL
jgi:glycosyltransferase involved in cell wall biosynthesis